MKKAKLPNFKLLVVTSTVFKRGAIVLISGVGLYGITAYILFPALWRHYERNPKLEHSPKITQTAEGIPGDPVNIGLVGTETEILQAMSKADWQLADSVTVGSSLGMARSVLLKHSYPTAPVSSLFLNGHKQELAFEQAVGSSATKRHHVRFWRSESDPETNRPLWIGSATFDRSAGVSHLTGQITHHIEADIDAERDNVLQNLTQVQQVIGEYQVTGVGATVQGRNGGGDWYYTDGEVTIAILPINNTSQPFTAAPSSTAPEMVKTKNAVWKWFRQTFKPKS